MLTTFLMFATITSQAQQAGVLSEAPQAKEQFILSEKNVPVPYNWRRNTTLQENEEWLWKQATLLLDCVTGLTAITLVINADLLTF